MSHSILARRDAWLLKAIPYIEEDNAMALPLTAIPSYRTLGKPRERRVHLLYPGAGGDECVGTGGGDCDSGCALRHSVRNGTVVDIRRARIFAREVVAVPQCDGAVLQFRFWRTTAGRSSDTDCGLRGCTGRSDGSEGRSGSGHGGGTDDPLPGRGCRLCLAETTRFPFR